MNTIDLEKEILLLNLLLQDTNLKIIDIKIKLPNGESILLKNL
ncbi:hypothetical protein [Arcobacter sp. LA11]|nr:hypothetical protein [Arcobacter sp. LA11]